MRRTRRERGARVGCGRVLRAPASRAALVRGADQMAALVRPTLGPLARTVVIAGQFPSDTPEILDHAATILRRTIQIDDPFADMGAMLVRHLAWSVFQRVGDGAATAVTLAHALIHEAAVTSAAGADANALRRGMESGLAAARAALHTQARPVETAAALAGCVAGIVRDAALADSIGEVVDSVGPDGAVLIEDWQGTSVKTDYLDGVQWKGGLLSPYLLSAGETAGRVQEPRIVLTDRPLITVNDLLPILDACVAAGERRLLVIAPEVRAAALGLLIANRERGVLDGVLAVRAPGNDDTRAAILEDIAVVTGARVFLTATGARTADVTIADLGSARQAWATADTFCILGGRGEKAAIRQRIATLKAALRQTAPEDDRARDALRERIGKLAGTAAVLSLGAPTDAARAELRTRVGAAVRAAQAALAEGVVPGGGAALLACVPAVERLAMELDGDAARGARILARALAAPLRTIAANAGLDASALFAEPCARADGWTFDVVARRWVDAWDAGIVDPLAVVDTALVGSVSAAAMAVMTDVLVRRRRPPRATDP